MANQTSTTSTNGSAVSNRKRLFIGSCLALIATSVAFATVGAIMLALKREFVLTNAEVGWIGGAALWGFAVSQVIFAPFCDNLGFRFLLRLAFIGHLIGTALMIAAGGFWMLFFGALVIALGNGLVEAACNPLVATLYPERKAVKLNQFHVWFPGGIVIGGVAAFLMDQVGLGAWELKLALILIPTLAYGVIMLMERFPASENVQAGVSMSEMFKATFFTPLMWLMLFCMVITASTELGPNRWVPAVLEAGLSEAGFVGVGILVLAWINGIMAVMRYFAGKTVEQLSPTLVLLLSSIVAAIGLYMLSWANTPLMAFVSATVFAVGVAYFWPTMLGFVAERIPRSGALGLGLMGAAGMAVVGLFTAPQMGQIADEYAHEYLENRRVDATLSVMDRAADVFTSLSNEANGAFESQIIRAGELAAEVQRTYGNEQRLPEPETANALRAIIDSRVAVEEVSNNDPAAIAIVSSAQAVLSPADNYGGRISFRYIVPFTCLLIVIFGLLYWRDRRSGGYKATSVHTDADGEHAHRKADDQTPVSARVGE